VTAPTLEDLLRRRTLAAAEKTAKRAADRARAHGYAGDNFTGSEWLALVLHSGGACLKCGEADPTVDHVIPLALGGPNTIANVQVLCAPCNSEKGGEVLDYRTA
jgi:5-methylcytosine-specific restriction endonuclease McrA